MQKTKVRIEHIFSATALAISLFALYQASNNEDFDQDTMIRNQDLYLQEDIQSWVVAQKEIFEQMEDAARSSLDDEDFELISANLVSLSKSHENIENDASELLAQVRELIAVSSYTSEEMQQVQMTISENSNIKYKSMIIRNEMNLLIGVFERIGQRED